MDKLFNKFFDFLTNKKHALPLRLSAVILALVLAVFINDILGFSFSYSVNQKTKQLQAISELRKNNPHNQNYLTRLDTLENEVFGRKPFYKKLKLL